MFWTTSASTRRSSVWALVLDLVLGLVLDDVHFDPAVLCLGVVLDLVLESAWDDVHFYPAVLVLDSVVDAALDVVLELVVVFGLGRGRGLELGWSLDSVVDVALDLVLDSALDVVLTWSWR